jgi:hypothetical protein
MQCLRGEVIFTIRMLGALKQVILSFEFGLPFKFTCSVLYE